MMSEYCTRTPFWRFLKLRSVSIGDLSKSDEENARNGGEEEKEPCFRVGQRFDESILARRCLGIIRQFKLEVAHW